MLTLGTAVEPRVYYNITWRWRYKVLRLKDPSLCVTLQLFTGADPALARPAGGRGETPGPKVLLYCPGFVPERASSLRTQKGLGAAITWGKEVNLIKWITYFIKQNKIMLVFFWICWPLPQMSLIKLYKIKPPYSTFSGKSIYLRNLEMEELSQRSMWPSFLWRWVGRRRHPMLWQCKWMQKERSNMMPSPDKDRARTRYVPIQQNLLCWKVCPHVRHHCFHLFSSSSHCSFVPLRQALT